MRLVLWKEPFSGSFFAILGRRRPINEENLERKTHMSSSTSGNFIAAIASFFVPGLGQLIQGRIIAALVFFVVSVGLWFFFLGWLGHIVACLEAAFWRRR